MSLPVFEYYNIYYHNSDMDNGASVPSFNLNKKYVALPEANR
jgi:hypothetical protein